MSPKMLRIQVSVFAITASAIVVLAASPACAQGVPARAEKAYMQCLLAHALDERSGDEKSVLTKAIDKCAQELRFVH